MGVLKEFPNVSFDRKKIKLGGLKGESYFFFLLFILLFFLASSPVNIPPSRYFTRYFFTVKDLENTEPPLVLVLGVDDELRRDPITGNSDQHSEAVSRQCEITSHLR